jgi:hypothetical protein
MSRELQEQADKIIRELLDSLVPIQEELRILKNSSDRKKIKILK